MKPTWNAISREGQKIYSLTMDTLGLYGRSVDDLELLASVFALNDDTEPSTIQMKASKFALIKTMAWPEVGPGTAEAMEMATQLLQAHGAEVDEIELPVEFHELLAWHRIVMTCEGRGSFLPDYRTAKEQLHESLVGTVENIRGVTHKEHLRAYDGIAALRPKIDEIAGRYVAILTPSVPDEAPVGTESTGSASFNSIWTV
jgi:Asp-tRNA(Asn)/Glu-tRNA(Gln) amidotransferase A subunit family amidase